MAEVLLIDDDAGLTGLLADYLRQADFTAHCVGDGRAVILLYKQLEAVCQSVFVCLGFHGAESA